MTGPEGTERQAQFSGFLRELAARRARVRAIAPPFYTDIECPACGAWFGIRNTADDQRADCPECGRRYDVSYDADWEPERGWRASHQLRKAC